MAHNSSQVYITGKMAGNRVREKWKKGLQSILLWNYKKVLVPEGASLLYGYYKGAGLSRNGVMVGVKGMGGWKEVLRKFCKHHSRSWQTGLRYHKYLVEGGYFFILDNMASTSLYAIAKFITKAHWAFKGLKTRARVEAFFDRFAPVLRQAGLGSFMNWVSWKFRKFVPDFSRENRFVDDIYKEAYRQLGLIINPSRVIIKPMRALYNSG